MDTCSVNSLRCMKVGCQHEKKSSAYVTVLTTFSLSLMTKKCAQQKSSSKGSVKDPPLWPHFETGPHLMKFIHNLKEYIFTIYSHHVNFKEYIHHILSHHAPIYILCFLISKIENSNITKQATEGMFMLDFYIPSPSLCKIRRDKLIPKAMVRDIFHEWLVKFHEHIIKLSQLQVDL